MEKVDGQRTHARERRGVGIQQGQGQTLEVQHFKGAVKEPMAGGHITREKRGGVTETESKGSPGYQRLRTNPERN